MRQKHYCKDVCDDKCATEGCRKIRKPPVTEMEMLTIDVGQVVIESREETHGDYTKQAILAQALKAQIRSNGYEKLSMAQRESLDMIAVKISRILNGNPNEPDHWTDIAGYATLIANMLTKGTHL